MSSGSILRGHLRPVGARGPPFLIILLLVIILILGFNYWNLSAEYDTLLKETADLQDHLRLAVLKKETADRQYEAFEKRYRESEAQLGKLKLSVDQKDHEISKISERLDLKNEEDKQVKSQLTSCQAINAKLEMNSGMIEELQKKTSQLEEQKNSLSQENRKMLKTINALRFKIEEMEFHQSNVQIVPQPQPNPFLIRSKSQNAKQPPGQLKVLNPRTVRVYSRGMNGITVYLGGPLMPNLPDEESNAINSDALKYQHSKERDFNNEGTINQDEAAIKILNSTLQIKKMDISNNANNLDNNQIPNMEENKPEGENIEQKPGENIEQKPDENIEQKPDENKIPVSYPDNETVSEAAEGLEKVESNAVDSKTVNATNTVKMKADVISNQEEKVNHNMLKNNPEYNEIESQNIKLNATENPPKVNEGNNAQKEDKVQVVKQSGEIAVQTSSPDLNDIPKV